MTAKILPPFFQGEPPRAGVEGRMDPIAWRIEVQGRRCGVSVSQATPGELTSNELHSRVLLEQLPLPEVVPPWTQGLMRSLGAPGLLQSLGDMKLDLKNQITFDSLGSLASFQTRVRVNDIASVARMSGRVRDGILKLRVQTGEYVRRTEHLWREKSLLGGQLSPEPKLLNVYVGRRWREEVYSPLRGPGQPAELIEAEVVEEEPLLHEGELVLTNRIVYRTLSPAGISMKDRLRAVVWVREDGHVIRQDAYFMNTCLRFTRLSAEESAELAEELLDINTAPSPDAPSDADAVVASPAAPRLP